MFALTIWRPATLKFISGEGLSLDFVVTGGAGYIGGHLVDRLANLGDVTAIDDFSSGSYRNRRAKYVKADLSRERPKIAKGSLVYHLTADPDVRESMQQAQEHFDRDVRATLNAAEMARSCDASGIIFTSSSTVYGEADRIPTPESERLSPISYYGLYKMLGEQVLEFYGKNYGMPITSLRLANIIGGRMSHGVIVDFIRKLRLNPEKLEILGNGRQRKSYVHVNDLIDLLVGLKLNGVKTYNVGNKDWVTVERIAQIVEEGMHISPQHVFNDTHDGRGWEGDVRLMMLDSSLIERGTGWRPSITSEEAVRKAVNELLQIKQ